MTRKSILYSSAAVALAMATQGVSIDTARAQDADDDGFSIEEIIVTARKREENIQEAPLSIAAFTSNMIEAANIKTLDDVAKFTAGFSFDEDFQRSASSRPVIRGQSSILGASGVSTFVDGVLITGTILDYDLGDVERIEIIKGPQSALYGRNTYSGAISIVTKSPTDELSGRIKVEAGSHSQSDVSASIRGPISDTVSGSLTGRYYDRGGPFTNTYDNAKVGQQESKSLSGVLYFKPSEKTDVRLRARWSELEDDQPRFFTTDPEDNNCFPDIGGTYLGNSRYFCGEITERPINVDDVRLLDRSGIDKSTNWETSLTVEHELSDNLSLTWINGYNHSKSAGQQDFGGDPESLAPFAVYIGPVFPLFGPYWFHAYVLDGTAIDFAASSEGSGWDYSSELRLDYQGDGWDALLGGYYFENESNSRGTRVPSAGTAAIIAESYALNEARMIAQCAAHAGDAGAPCFSVPGFDSILNFGSALEDVEFPADRSLSQSKRNNFAIFGMLSKDLGEDLIVTAEGRFQREEITSIRTPISNVYDFEGNYLRTDTFDTSNRNASFTSFTPRFTMEYAATDDSNLYAVAARGTKPGGFNSALLTSLGLDTFDEESVWSFEAGSKNTFVDGQLIFNLAIFHNTIKGYQLTQSVLIPTTDGSPPSETTTVIDNVGKVRLKGIEIDLVYAPSAIRGLVFNANYALTDSNILEGTDINEGKLDDALDDMRVNCSTGLQNPTVGCSSGDNVLLGSIVGRQLPRQAKHMYNIGVNFTRSITDDWSVVMNGNISHESKKFVQVHNLAWTGSTTLLNASFGFESDTGLRLIFWGKNLTKEDAVVSASRFADAIYSFQRNFLGNPRIGRTFGGSITKTF